MVKTTTKKGEKKDTLDTSHWSNRRSTEVDRNKRSCVEPGKIDTANVITTPRARKNINYKTVQLKGEVQMVKRNTANTYEKRSTTKIEKKKKAPATKKTTKKTTKKDEKPAEEEKKDE